MASDYSGSAGRDRTQGLDSTCLPHAAGNELPCRRHGISVRFLRPDSSSIRVVSCRRKVRLGRSRIPEYDDKRVSDCGDHHPHLVQYQGLANPVVRQPEVITVVLVSIYEAELTRMLVACCIVVSGYAAANRWVSRYARVLAVRIQALQRDPLRIIENRIRMLLWTAALTLICTATLLVLRVSESQLVSTRIRLLSGPYAVFGLLVGVGESGVASLLSYAVLSLPSAHQWLGTRERTNIRTIHLGTGKGKPLLHSLGLLIIATILMFVYAAVEEVMLRGAFIASARHIGIYSAVCISVLLSLVIQAFPGTTGKRSIFPFIGAIVSAPAHAVLLVAVPDVRPLIIAQFTGVLLNRE